MCSDGWLLDEVGSTMAAGNRLVVEVREDCTVVVVSRVVVAIVGAVECPDCFALVSTEAGIEADVGAVGTAGDAANSETALSETLKLLATGGATGSAPDGTGAFTVALCCPEGDTGGTNGVEAAFESVDCISGVAALNELFDAVVAGTIALPGDTGAFAGAAVSPDAFVGSLDRFEPLVVSIC